MKKSAERVKAEITREVERAERRRRRAELVELERELAQARAAHRGQMSLARRRCVEARKGLRDTFRARRERLLAELRATVAAEKLAAREKCDEGIRSALTLADRKAKAKAKADAEREYQRSVRALKSKTTEREAAIRKRSTAAERRTESDDEVRGNIPPELVHLFNKVRGVIKAGPRQSRTEAFLEYAEEHPAEYLEAIEDRTDALIRELESRYARIDRVRT